MAIKLGITGTVSSGKSTVKDCFEKMNLNFIYTSLSDAIREEATKRNLDHSREVLVSIGNELREKYGTGIWAKKILEKFSSLESKYDVVLIDGIRNPGEIEELKKDPGFYLLGIDASFNIRWERIQKRNRQGDPQNKEEFKKLDYADRGFNQDQKTQQVEKCLEYADYLIWNEKPVENLEKSHLYQKVLDAYRIFSKQSPKRRPNFEEVFMDNAYNWAARSTCIRRKVGAVAAKNNKQLTAGYNGAPSKFKSCDEKNYCLRNKLKIPSGQQLDICWAVHAEQNVINQAASNGIKLDGATLYITNHPCFTCSKSLINAGIKEIIYGRYYPDKFSEECLENAKESNGINIRRFEGVSWNQFKNVFLRI